MGGCIIRSEDEKYQSSPDFEKAQSPISTFFFMAVK